MFFAFVKGNCGNFFAGGRLFVAGSTLPPLYPAGGVLSLSPADFAFSLIFCPHPPTPFPAGRGRL